MNRFVKKIIPLIVLIVLLVVLIALGLAGTYISKLGTWCLSFLKGNWLTLLLMAASYLAACIYNQITEELEKKKASSSTANKRTERKEATKGEGSKDDEEREEKIVRRVEL